MKKSTVTRVGSYLPHEVKLYHGTTTARISNPKGWDDTRGDLLYLAEDPGTAESYAEMRADDDMDEFDDYDIEPVVLVFDSEVLLKQGNLGPDLDDAWSAYKSGQYPEPPEQWDWELSLDRLGTCAYSGPLKGALLGKLERGRIRPLDKSVKPLKQLIESLVCEVLHEVNSNERFRKSNDQSFDMSFEEWFSSLGGMEEILSEYDISFDDYYWLRDELEDEDDEEAFEKLAVERVYEELENSFYDWSSKWTSFDYPLTLYRCISLDKPGALKYKQLGVFWSDDYDSAECHWGHGAGEKYIVVIEVELDDIDQGATMYHNMHPSLGETEKEVTLHSGRSVIVKSIIHPDGREEEIEKVAVT